MTASENKYREAVEKRIKWAAGRLARIYRELGCKVRFETSRVSESTYVVVRRADGEETQIGLSGHDNRRGGDRIIVLDGDRLISRYELEQRVEKFRNVAKWWMAK